MTAPALYETFGSTVQRQYAQRADGPWFTRYKTRTQWGWTWSKWEATQYVPPVWDGDHALATGMMPASQYAGTVRLPKVAT